MIKRAEIVAKDIRAGEPGDRFHRYWRLRQIDRSHHPLRRALWIGLGLAMVLIGAILGPTPLVPGFVIGIPGLAILASQLRWLSKAFDKVELFLRRFLGRKDRS